MTDTAHPHLSLMELYLPGDRWQYRHRGQIDWTEGPRDREPQWLWGNEYQLVERTAPPPTIVLPPAIEGNYFIIRNTSKKPVQVDGRSVAPGDVFTSHCEGCTTPYTAHTAPCPQAPFVNVPPQAIGYGLPASTSPQGGGFAVDHDGRLHRMEQRLIRLMADHREHGATINYAALLRVLDGQ